MMLFDNNLVYQSPCESILKIAAFLDPRWLPIVGTGAAALVAESWQSRYYIILYIIDAAVAIINTSLAQKAYIFL